MHDISTQKFLCTFWENVFTDFEDENWCEINKFNFKSNAYHSPVIQQHYILKYFPAYFCEYYYAFEDFIERITEIHLRKNQNLSVLSIGCGCGIDFYALERIIADRGLNLPFRYTGIDLVNWNYQPQSSNFKFIQTDITLIPAKEMEKINLIVFPKSIIEIKEEALSEFARKVTASHRIKTMFFMNSYITENSDDPRCVKGIDQFEIIYSEMINNGFKTTDDINVYNYHDNHAAGLRSNFPFFRISDEIITTLHTLKSRCTMRDYNNFRCQWCRIDFWPILKSQYMAYNILKFTRP